MIKIKTKETSQPRKNQFLLLPELAERKKIKELMLSQNYLQSLPSPNADSDNSN